jgi:queuine/archaeosine tRNA-ribosyltransferase
MHNLRFLLDLTARARAAIERGELESYISTARARLAEAPKETP